MKKNIIRHLTVEGFAHSSDLSNCEILEQEFNVAKSKFKLAKKEVKTAKDKLNVALEDVISKIEIKKKEIKKTQKNLVDNTITSSVFNTENIKSHYEKTMSELELRKNKLKNKIEAYSEDGTEQWESFKNKLNHDLDDLGKVLKGFVTKG